MANIEKCILELRLLGHKARMTGSLESLGTSISEVFGHSLVVRCQGFTVAFNETLGISIESLPPADALGILDYSKHHFSIHYPFDDQSFLFSMQDDAFVECILLHIREASEMVSALPDRLRPGWRRASG